MRVYIIPNLTKDIGAAVALRAAQTLIKFGATPMFSAEISSFFASGWQQTYPCFIVQAAQACYEQADIIVTIGGDGTILHVAIESLPYGKPILGINLGRCGFLTTCEADEFQEKFARLVQGDYTLDTRSLLNASIHGKQLSNRTEDCTTQHWQSLALNDVVISKGHTQQAIDLSVYCDDILVESYRCDGVIVATPTGSTAYSLASGGPIVDSQTRGIVLTAICPHKLRAPSMVFAPNRVLRVVVGAASRGEVLLSYDGKPGMPLQENESVEITLSDQQIQLVSFSDAAQFEAIDRKIRSKD